MIYTQLFNLLCEKADDVYGGRLPVHVRCLIDEMANIGQIPNLEKLVATIRSREISACLVLQAQSQLKAIYKDNADTIIGNMDSRIFLGGSEPTTLKELNQALGKETIDTYNTSNTRGNSPSYGLNYQKLGKARNTDNHLYLMVLEHYSGLRGIDIHAMTVPVFLKELDRRSFPGFETVRRSRQKVQATYPDLAPSEAVGKRRAKNEVVYREFAESEV